MNSCTCIMETVEFQTKEKLDAIGQAEAFLHEQEFPIVRVRHHGKVARIEVPEENFTRLAEIRKMINDHLKELGFTWVALDLAGFKSGGLNVVIETGTENQKG